MISRLENSLDAFGEVKRARRALAAAAVGEMRAKRMNGELIESEFALEAVNALVMRFRAKVLSVLPRIARESYGA
jgi:hypothetical protein